MNMEVVADPGSVAKEAAAIIAQEARLSVSARGRFVMAVSSGATSLLVLRDLTGEQVVWERMQVVQADECLAPLSDPCRAITGMRETLLEYFLLRPQQLHSMPVEARDLEIAAARYALSLHRIAGSPPVLDLVLLELGRHGRAAGLIAGDPALDVTDQDVSLTNVYGGKRWMTLTYPILNRARFVLWTATGADHAEMLGRLREEDHSVPAGRIRGGAGLILADRAAAGEFTTPYHRR
jgi:6-phosphogluconolactonase